MNSESQNMNEGGKPEIDTPAKLELLEINEINLAIQSQVCLSEGPNEPNPEVVQIEIEDKAFSENGQNELAISEKFSDDGFMTSTTECIEFDEAIRRIGGFGPYQAILFLAVSVIAIYGD
jgi:hypothetical protein